jgi:hypothetical protein
LQGAQAEPAWPAARVKDDIGLGKEGVAVEVPLAHVTPCHGGGRRGGLSLESLARSRSPPQARDTARNAGRKEPTTPFSIRPHGPLPKRLGHPQSHPPMDRKGLNNAAENPSFCIEKALFRVFLALAPPPPLRLPFRTHPRILTPAEQPETQRQDKPRGHPHQLSEHLQELRLPPVVRTPSFGLMDGERTGLIGPTARESPRSSRSGRVGEVDEGMVSPHRGLHAVIWNRPIVSRTRIKAHRPAALYNA